MSSETQTNANPAGQSDEVFVDIVRWGPNDGLQAGVKITRMIDDTEVFVRFAPWQEYLIQLETNLMPQLFADPASFRFAVRDYHGKKDWLVRIQDNRNSDYCALWLGGDPDAGWAADGLVRVGDPNARPHTWQAYQQLSDGTFRCVFSLCGSLDEMRRARPGDH